MDIWFKAKVDWGEALGLLSDTEAGRFAKALWKYAATGEAGTLTGREQMLFALVLADLRREAEHRERISALRSEATGINVDRMRIVGTMLSTVLGAVGILVYSQSYGFMQLYTAPRQMGFIAASAILIGGASTSRCKISHVIIGTFLFQGVLTLGMPVANMLVPGTTLSETLRILISNGIILYALTKSGGGSRA